MELILACPPEHLRAAMAYTNHIAHEAWRIGPEGRLIEAALPAALRGGWLVAADEGAAPADAGALAEELTRRCRQRSFCGVALDPAGPIRCDRGELLALLEQRLGAIRRELLVPEVYAAAVQRAPVLIGTALSGGDLRTRLREAVECFGAQRVALRVERVRMDFPLPCPAGEGQALTAQELRTLAGGRSIFFSEPLCARYFTCRRADGPHFVLFDDADTIRRKLTIAEEMGISTALLSFEELQDVLPQLLGDVRG